MITEKSTRDGILYQPLQVNVEKFEVAITFLTGNNGILKSQTETIDFHSLKFLMGKISKNIFKLQRDYEIESLEMNSNELSLMKDMLQKQQVCAKSNQFLNIYRN